MVLSSVSCGALSCNDLPVVGAARAHVGDPWVELDEGDVRALICFRFASPLASRVRPSLSWGAVGVRVWSDLARHLIRWCARAERLHDEALTLMVRRSVGFSMLSAHVRLPRLPRVSCVSAGGRAREEAVRVNVNELDC